MTKHCASGHFAQPKLFDIRSDPPDGDIPRRCNSIIECYHIRASRHDKNIIKLILLSTSFYVLIPLHRAVTAVQTARKYRFDRTVRPEIPDFGSTKPTPTRHG